MTHRALTAFLLLALTPTLPGCNGDSYSAPTAPSPASVTFPVAPRPPSPTSYTWSPANSLSGLVYEQTADGRRPIEGVDVYCEPCGKETHTWATTDANGLYRFTDGVWTDPTNFPTRVSVTKNGFRDPAGLPRPTPPNPASAGWREVVIIGDTRFDVELVRQ